MKKIDKNLMQTVLEALNWDEQQYAAFIEQCGHAYLNAFIKGFPQVIEQITRSKTFWNWWKMHWEKREMEFVETITEYPESVTSVHALHMDIHDPIELAGSKYLNGKVLEESYLNLIDEITKEQTQIKKVDVCQI